MKSKTCHRLWIPTYNDDQLRIRIIYCTIKVCRTNLFFPFYLFVLFCCPECVLKQVEARNRRYGYRHSLGWLFYKYDEIARVDGKASTLQSLAYLFSSVWRYREWMGGSLHQRRDPARDMKALTHMQENIWTHTTYTKRPLAWCGMRTYGRRNPVWLLVPHFTRLTIADQ